MFQRLPNFFIVGAPKAGTTSLYYYLGQHPQIYVSPIKEPHFFAAEMRLENFEPALRRRIARDTRGLAEFLCGPMREKRFDGVVADRENYLRLFANANGELAVGEASACYLWLPTAPERIASEIPDARILALLRDPAERAFSQYLHGVGNGAIRWSFREHIQRNLRHRSGQLAIHYPFDSSVFTTSKSSVIGSISVGTFGSGSMRISRFGPWIFASTRAVSSEWRPSLNPTLGAGIWRLRFPV